MTFAERHAQIDADPFKELHRRTALWASCPGADGHSLEPHAQIIPRVTIDAALKEIWVLRQRTFWSHVATGFALVAVVVILVT